jgi:putative flippase GtrA
MSKKSSVVPNHEAKLRFLIVGAWNTAFGYVISIALYSLLKHHLNVVAITTLGSIASITNAFILHKIFVFRTQGNWLIEYFRSYLTYGITSIIGIGLVSLMVEMLGLAFWIAQGLAIAVVIPASFILHKKFTFTLTKISNGKKTD